MKISHFYNKTKQMEHEIKVKKSLYESHNIHRDISWLSFNARVLQEAKDIRNPLLERVKFLGIYSKNLSEFFHVRMPYHLNLIRINKSTRKQLSFSPKRLVKKLISIVNQQQIEFTRIFNSEIIPELQNHDISFKNLENITENQLKYIHEYFTNTVRLHVDPLLMRGKSVSPFLKDASLYLGILLTDKHSKFDIKSNEYGLVRIPSDILPRFIVLPTEGARNDIIMLDDVVRYGLCFLFPGFEVEAAYSFKMTRDAELYIDNSVSGELKDAIKKSLHKRQVGIPARFVYDRNMPQDLLTFLTDSFDLGKYDKIKEGRYQNYHDLLSFPSFGKNELLNQPLENLKYSPLEDSIDPLEIILKSDHFIHPPYHSFESVIRFFEFSSKDPMVTELMITQYRIGDNSRILNALIFAAQNGKKVTVFLEIQARFDEQSNLTWGEKLEDAGVTVIYSMPGVKVHCKIGLVKRKENNVIQKYAILSTGNFHEYNSKIYSDMCLFSSDNRICGEVDLIFEYLGSKPSQAPVFDHLLVGKINLRKELVQLIDNEIESAKNNKKGHIILKMNSLEDPLIIEKLYEASNAMVKIELIVRGICCLVPGVPEVSENIRIISILDRYLEHARVYYFYANGYKKLYLSSADWMTRNLSRRIEAAFPVYDKNIKKTIINLLKIQLLDNVKTRIIDVKQLNDYVTNKNQPIQSQHCTHYMFKKKTSKQTAIGSNRLVYGYSD